MSMGDKSIRSDRDSPVQKVDSPGFGNPDDTRLRKIERDVLIKDRVRKVAKERCADLMKVFANCAKDNGLLFPFVCRGENDAQLMCLAKWFNDKQLNDEVTREYLNERSEFRRTGIPAKMRAKESVEVK